MTDLMSGGLHRLWKDRLVSDLNPFPGMKHLDVAGGTGDRAIERGYGNNDSLKWVEGDAEKLGFEDNSMDGYTIAFGIRNVTHIEKALAEAYRVLKRGGRFLCLELSHVDIPVFKDFYDYYSFSVIPAVGEMVTGDRESYQYLVESVRKFPNQEKYAGLIADAGFQKVQYENLVGGVVAIHSGLKI
ncbi:2-methoxy-6-polyprenyl-1,4-benzoquinol methylase [Ranunculus cassubicifolius]